MTAPAEIIGAWRRVGSRRGVPWRYIAVFTDGGSGSVTLDDGPPGAWRWFRSASNGATIAYGDALTSAAAKGACERARERGGAS